MHLCPCHRVCGCVGVWVSGCGCLECVICDVRVLVCACVVHARLVSPLVRTQGVHQLEKAKQSQKDARQAKANKARGLATKTQGGAAD